MLRSIIFLLFFIYSNLAFSENKTKVENGVPTDIEAQTPSDGGKIQVSEVDKNIKTDETKKNDLKPSTGTEVQKTYSEVVKVDKRRDRVSITDDPKRPWARKDTVCLYRVNRVVACGKVIAVGIRGAVVQLKSHTAMVKPHDEARYFEPDKIPPEITDDQLSAESLLEAKPYKYTIALGVHLGLDLRYPVAHFYWTVSPTIAVGLQPVYISMGGSTPTSRIKGFGGLLSVNYFGEEYFRGLWIHLGSGFYRIEATNGTTTETLNVPIVTLTGGWREDWAHGLNVGASAGFRFLSPLSGAITEAKYNSIHALVLLEVGYSF